MGAALDDIDAALYAGLQGLLTSAVPPGPFRLVDRYAGEITPQHGVDDELLGNAPAALLAFERETPQGQNGAFQEVLGREIQVVERSLWRVYVVVQDHRGDTEAIKGTTGQPGALTCAEAVKLALTGLDIPGLHDGSCVHRLETIPRVIQRGVAYCYMLRFAADSELVATPVTLPGAPMTALKGTISDPAATDPGASPLSTLTIDVLA